MAQLNTTELDFKKIKDNLKSYLKNSDSSFKDYDFEGSGLNHLLDVLAYNTHYNAINAHMAVNESFIDTAQVRANVVSHAKLVGYTPTSTSASRAVISVKLSRDSGTASSATISSGTVFTTAVNGVNYTFQTLADVVSNRYNATTGNFEFDTVEIFEGTSKSSKFFFNNINNQTFIIQDSNIDTSTLKVIVKDSSSALSSDTYVAYNVEANVNSASKVYYLAENYDGFFQFEFGNGVFSAKPIADSVIEATYLSASGTGPNGATTFTLTGSLPSETSLATTGAVTTITNATGGAPKESIESIKFNAPRSFIAQNRAVTADDYEVAVREALADAQDVSIYGGQDLVPPQYGKVFISVKPKSGLFLTEGQKKTLLDFLTRKKIVTVQPVIVDADYTYLYFNITTKYNTSLTSLTRAQLESAVRSKIDSFNNTFLQSYGNNFRYSKFLSVVDSADRSISGSTAQVYCFKRLTFRENDTAGMNLNFGFKLLGDIQQKGSFISSTGWVYNNKTYFIEDVAIEGDANRRLLQRYYINENNAKVTESANEGYLYPATGEIQLNAQPTTVQAFVDFTVIPLSYDIPGIENKLLTIDLTKTSIAGDANAATVSGGIVPESYVSVPGAATTAASYNPMASGTFVPHTMYDPNTGTAYFASTIALHNQYAALGYVHYIPTLTRTGTTTTTSTTETSSTEQGTTDNSGFTGGLGSGTGGTGGGDSQSDGGGYTPPPSSGGDYTYP